MTPNPLPTSEAFADADLQLWPAFLPAEHAQALLLQLIDETPWRQESITLWGRTVPQPRLIAWYGDPGKHYRYSGLGLSPQGWTPTLTTLREQLQRACDAPFNSVLLNYYRDGSDSMGMHSDDEKELGDAPVIASLSLGSTRRLVLQHRCDGAREKLSIDLTHGSLLRMGPRTQPNWKHGIPKTRRPCGPRVNLTFRYIV